MTELELSILHDIKKKKSGNEIMKLHSISHEELWNIIYSLEYQGFSFYRKYYYDGNIIYEFNKNIDEENKYNNQIIMGKNDNTFTAIVTADTHYGGSYENQSKMDAIGNLCAKLSINNIIHCGDFIDSFVNEKSTINNFISEQHKQIERALEIYPYDKNILHHVCLGNHDRYALAKAGLNLAKIFNNRRHDIIPIGWNQGMINIKRDKILVCHKVNRKFPFSTDANIILMGHKHHIGYEFCNQKFLIHVPAIDTSSKPIIKLTVKIEKGHFITCYIEELTVRDNINFEKTNELKFNLSDTLGESRVRRL